MPPGQVGGEEAPFRQRPTSRNMVSDILKIRVYTKGEMIYVALMQHEV